MEQRKPLSHITAGLLIAAALVLFSIVTNFLGLAANRGLSWVPYLILIAGLILFINLYGKARDHNVTFGNLFAYGFKTTAVFTVLFIVFLILFNLLFPEFKEKAMEIMRQQMEDQGKMSDEQIDQFIEMGRKFFWLGVIGGTLLGFIIIGAIGSLIGAAVTKKRPYNPLEQSPT